MEHVTTYDQHPIDKDFGSTILIVDDEALARKSLEVTCSLIEPKGSYRTLSASSIPEALEILSHSAVDVILLDKDIGPNRRDPSQNGIERIPEILTMQPHVQILMVTGSAEIGDAVRAMQLGAFNYIIKGSPQDLLTAQIKQAVSVSHLTQERMRETYAQKKPSIDFLAGSSSAMSGLKTKLYALSETSRPVLLLGESGTGKSTAAKLIHELRGSYLKQANRPFISLNMAAISETMAEGELFGNEAGAYTDAKFSRPGYFEMANHGTLFLDEIGETSLELQAKLLKALEEGKFYRLGGKTERHSRFKLICATNKNLEKLVAEKKFRQDLYMRISTFPVTVPTLSERKEDIPLIIESLLPRACVENQVFISYSDLPADFIEWATHHEFEGNIRGLDHALAHLLVFSPKDKRGRRHFRNWKETLNVTQARKSSSRNTHIPLSIKDLLDAPYDVVGSDFPGLTQTITRVTENIFRDAMSKHPKQADLARALKLSKGYLSSRLKQMQHSTATQQSSSSDSAQNPVKEMLQ